jgi:hypothetical protein
VLSSFSHGGLSIVSVSQSIVRPAWRGDADTNRAAILASPDRADGTTARAVHSSNGDNGEDREAFSFHEGWGSNSAADADIRRPDDGSDSDEPPPSTISNLPVTTSDSASGQSKGSTSQVQSNSGNAISIGEVTSVTAITAIQGTGIVGISGHSGGNGHHGGGTTGGEPNGGLPGTGSVEPSRTASEAAAGDQATTDETWAAIADRSRINTTAPAFTPATGQSDHDTKVPTGAEPVTDRPVAAPLNGAAVGTVSDDSLNRAILPDTIAAAEGVVLEQVADNSGVSRVVLVPEGSNQLMDRLTINSEVLQQAMRRFLDQVDALQDNLGLSAITRSAAAPLLLTGAVVTVAGDATRRRLRRAGGWTRAGRAHLADRGSLLPGFGF